MLGQQPGDVTHDTGAVVAHQVEVDRLPVAYRLDPAFRQEHADTVAGQAL